MYIRAEYGVGSDLRFLSNLDMYRMMERSFRRANIPYALSQGYNPHIKFSLGTVLPVGVWGEREYFDLELREPLAAQEFILQMNSAFPADVIINKCQVLELRPLALMRVINAASYAFAFEKGVDLQEIRARILNSSNLTIKSKGKNKDMDKDLRSGIFNIDVQLGDKSDIMEIWVAVGQPINIRYDELMDLLKGFVIDYRIIDVYRTGNYIWINDSFYTPLEKVS